MENPKDKKSHGILKEASENYEEQPGEEQPSPTHHEGETKPEEQD